jgi:ATP-dependent DNA helicase RecG
MPQSIPEQKAVKQLIKHGEGLTVEFKKCSKTLNRDVYETVCAFMNRHGGTLLLGVKDSGEVTGVDKDAVNQIRKDFVTSINNSQKMNPPTYLSVDEIEISRKIILKIYVPESSQVHRCNGRIYDRNEDGDLDITDNTQLVANLYLRKQTSYSENMVFPYARIEDLRSDIIEKCRKLSRLRQSDHPWLSLSDMELVKMAQLYRRDPATGKEGITLAGILLLGNDELILSALPHHRTDLLLRKVNLDRYDDRDFVTTNLIDTYGRIQAFVGKHLPDPFYLEGDSRVSLREKIFREVASNIIIHREYLNAFPAKLIIERGLVRTENSNRPHGFGPIDPTNFAPYPKNPAIANFFQQITWADEAGSGVRNLAKYCKEYGGKDAELIEGDIFRTVVVYPEFDTVLSENRVETMDNGRAYDKAQDRAQEELNRTEYNILRACQDNPASSSELFRILGYKSRTGNFKRALQHLLEIDFLEMMIPDQKKSRNQKYQITHLGKSILRKK